MIVEAGEVKAQPPKTARDAAPTQEVGRVSVVIPCYNSARTVVEAVESALNQTYPSVEVVVVDDGSTDDSVARLADYRDRIVLVQQVNRGLSAARNAGVDACTGEFVTLLDADDVLLPDCLAKRVEIMRASAEMGLVAGWFREIDADGTAIERVPELRKVWTEAPFRQAVRRNWGPPVGWTFRRDAYYRIGGFDPLLRSCEDWDFVIRMASRYQIGYDETVQVLYRKSSGQMSSHHHTMLDAAAKVHQKNRAWAKSRLSYWVDVQFGRFELGRRTLYAVLFQQKEKRLSTLARLTVRHPYLLWVFPMSAASYILGKRASSK